jgi:hypothetical protein
MVQRAHLGFIAVATRGDNPLDRIAETHGVLRESIETARKLVDESDYLIKRHREGG